MEISAIELIKFLGYSSIHEPFDDYLHAHGIKKRPNVGKDYNPYIEIKKQGLHLIFLTPGGVVENGVRQKTPGNYIFNSLDIYLKKGDGFSPYKGPLSFDLNASFSQLQIRNNLGKPKHVTFDEKWGANVDFYFVDSLVLAVKYTDMQGSAIEMIDYRLPDNWARENGIVPKL